MSTSNELVPGGDATPWTSESLLATLRECVDEVFQTMLGRVAHLAGHCVGSSGAERGCVDLEAVVEFKGLLDGAIVLRCSNAVAADIARGFLMMTEEESIDIAEVRDALGECANLVSGSLKSKALDPIGQFALGIPSLDGKVVHLPYEHHGTLSYSLVQGGAAVELWLDGTRGSLARS